MKSKHFLYQLFPYFCIAVFCSYVFLTELGNMDELWNYSFALNIHNGLFPYRDFNIIQTPLSSYIAAGFMTVFGEGLFTFRILSWIVLCVSCAVFFRLTVMLTKSVLPSLLITLFGALLLPEYFHYNNLLFLTTLVLLYLESKKRLCRARIPIYVTALSVGLTPLIKQTTGGVLALGYLLIILMDLHRRRVRIGEAIIGIICIGIPTLIFSVWLFATGLADDFFDYAVLGIGSFTHRFTLFRYMMTSVGDFLLALLTIGVFFFALYSILKRRRNRSYLAVYLILAVAFSTIAYPLCDTQHFCYVILVFLPLLFYLLDIKKTTHLQQIGLIAVCAVVTVMIPIVKNSMFEKDYRWSTLKHYEQIPVDEKIEESIDTVDHYILDLQEKGRDVYIAAYSAAAYMIPIDVYHKDFDMLLTGNLGTKTTEQLYRELKGSLVMVIRNEAEMNPQDNYELAGMIKENGVYYDKVEGYDVYEIE